MTNSRPVVHAPIETDEIMTDLLAIVANSTAEVPTPLSAIDIIVNAIHFGMLIALNYPEWTQTLSQSIPMSKAERRRTLECIRAVIEEHPIEIQTTAYKARHAAFEDPPDSQVIQ